MTITSLVLGLALQVPVDPNEITIQAAISQLSQSQTLYFNLTGQIVYKGKTTPIVTSLSWSTGTVGQKTLIQAEVEQWVNGTLVRRMVGDGDTFWNYDLLSHEYSASPYGGYGKTRPDSYQLDLLSDLNWASSGPSAYVAKLLRQVVNNTGTYTSWMPGVSSVNLPQNFPTSDPINNTQTYTPSQADWFFMYNGAPKRSIVFEIVPQTIGSSSIPVDTLQNIYLNQVDMVGRIPRYTQLQITPVANVTFSTSLFRPYLGSQIRGWRTIVGPKPASGG